MNDFNLHMLELASNGFECSQILLMLRLDAEGEENPSLIRAMGGLSGGIGFTGNTCGALTGGACLIGYYAGQGEREEMADSRLNEMITQLVEWFKEEYGCMDCSGILEGDMNNKRVRCPGIVEAVYFKCMEILAAAGYDLA